MHTLTAPLGELIASVGRSVGEAQLTIDVRTLEEFGALYDRNQEAFEILRAIAYQPTWYQVTEAAAEIALALTVKSAQIDASSSRRYRRDVHAAPVDAGYQSRFGYDMRAASSVKFRIIPVPPPAAAG
jgi:hypothetical protein